MASSREAFARLRKWKKSRTVLNLTVVTNGVVDRLQGAIFSVEGRRRAVGFVDDASRNHVCLDLRGDVIFRLDARSLEVIDEEFGTVKFVEVLKV
jgi:hypothetical protein